jgi:hypothetical protein
LILRKGHSKSEYVIVIENYLDNSTYFLYIDCTGAWSWTIERTCAYVFETKELAITFLDTHWGTVVVGQYSIKLLPFYKEDAFVDSSEGPFFENE